MNRRPLFLNPSQAVPGFLQQKTAEGLSPTTLLSYKHWLAVWLSHVPNVPLDRIKTQNLREFFAWLRTDYQPRRFSGIHQPLAPKSIRNVWVTLCAFFTWACTEFKFDNPMQGIPAPKIVDTPIEPFTKEQVESLLKHIDHCKPAQTERRKTFTMRRMTARRDRAMILCLLDTGLRASEFCALTIGDVDQKTGRVQVKHGALGGAKGGKGRVVFLGKAARSALWRYLVERGGDQDANASLFCTRTGCPMNKTALRLMLVDLGKKAQVEKCHPHRFRHTFAITYLRSGGDVFTLQALLGHSTLEMVQHYARIAEIDIAQVHRRASPADNWHL